MFTTTTAAAAIIVILAAHGVVTKCFCVLFQ
jgi:hypothetical protein